MSEVAGHFSEQFCSLRRPMDGFTLRLKDKPFSKMAEQTEDLKAFERRLTEVIDKLQPAARGWRMLLIVVSIMTAVAAWAWLSDPRTSQVTFTQSLLYHPIFALSCVALLLLFLFGIHKRVVAPSIIASRCRQVLAEYNMSCDETGKLILKPRPAT